MSETENTPLAGGSEATALSMEAAVAQLDALEQQPLAGGAEEQPNSEPVQEQPPAQAEGGEGTGENEEVQPEALAGAVGENAPEELPVEFEKLHGNTKVILRDGTTLRVGELKQRIEELQGLDRHKQEFEGERSQFQQQTAQFAHQARLFSEIAPKAIAALQAQVPPAPQAPAYDPADPLKYLEQKAEYDAKVAERNEKIGQIQQITALQQHQQQEAVRAQQQGYEQYLRSAIEQVKAEFPETREPASAQKFAQEILEYGRLNDFTEQELSGLSDPRLIRIVRKAMKYDAEKANPPKPVARVAPNPAPVARPGPRGTSADRAAAGREELRARVNKPGGLSMQDAASLLNSL